MNNIMTSLLTLVYLYNGAPGPAQHLCAQLSVACSARAEALMAQCYCSAVLMATPEEAEQDVSLHSTIEGGEVRSFRLAGPRLKIECIVNPALVQFAIGNSPKVI